MLYCLDKQQGQATWGKHLIPHAKDCFYVNTPHREIYAHNGCNSKYKIQSSAIHPYTMHLCTSNKVYFDICICRQLIFVCSGWGERGHGVPWPKIHNSSEWVCYHGLPYILLRHVCLSLSRPINALRGKTNKAHMHIPTKALGSLHAHPFRRVLKKQVTGKFNGDMFCLWFVWPWWFVLSLSHSHGEHTDAYAQTWRLKIRGWSLGCNEITLPELTSTWTWPTLMLLDFFLFLFFFYTSYNNVTWPALNLRLNRMHGSLFISCVL